MQSLRQSFEQNSFPFSYSINLAGRYQEVEHRVYWKAPSESPSAAVLVMHELPGLTEKCLQFADRLVDQGFTVYLPLFFGQFGEPSAPLPQRVNTLKFTAQLCLSREFYLLKAGASSPIVDWLRGLCQHLYQKPEHQGFAGVGAIGMCLTGGFVLSLMLEQVVVAPIASQPSLPLGVTPGLRKALDISSEDLEQAKQRAATTQLLLVRFEEDIVSPTARQHTLEYVFDQALDKVVITAQQRQQEGIRACPHAVFTEHFADDQGCPYQSTQAAFDQVVQFLRARLMPNQASQV